MIKYYELRNKSVLVLCPKKLADNWQTYNKNYTTNILAEDRFRYDVLAHTDLLRDRGESLGMSLEYVNRGAYDLVVIGESHNFRNDDATQAQSEADARYRALLNKAIRALDDYAKSAADMADGIENAITSAFSGAENAVAEFVKTGKLDVSDLVSSILADLARLAVRQSALGPPSSALSSVLTSGFGEVFGGGAGDTSIDAVTLHRGGTVGAAGVPTRVPASLFAAAPHLHDGGLALKPDEVPAILQTGERVLSRREVAEGARTAAPITVNIYAQDARSFMASRTQVASELSRMAEAGRGGR